MVIWTILKNGQKMVKKGQRGPKGQKMSKRAKMSKSRKMSNWAKKDEKYSK